MLLRDVSLAVFSYIIQLECRRLCRHGSGCGEGKIFQHLLVKSWGCGFQKLLSLFEKCAIFTPVSYSLSWLQWLLSIFLKPCPSWPFHCRWYRKNGAVAKAHFSSWEIFLNCLMNYLSLELRHLLGRRFYMGVKMATLFLSQLTLSEDLSQIATMKNV